MFLAVIVRALFVYRYVASPDLLCPRGLVGGGVRERERERGEFSL